MLSEGAFSFALWKSSLLHFFLHLGVHIVTFLQFSDPEKALNCWLEVLASSFFERLNAELSAILHDFDVSVADWKVLALHSVRFLILITLKFFRGKSTNATVLFLISHHLQIIFLNLVLLVLLNDKTEVLDLPLNLLSNRSRLNNHWWLAHLWRGCGFLVLLWPYYVVCIVHQILVEWLRMNIGNLAFTEVEAPLRALQ